MISHLRIWLVAAAASALVLAVRFLPSSPGEGYPYAPSPDERPEVTPASQSRLECETSLADKLDARLRVLAARAAAKRRLAADLVEGRVSLLQAAARLRALDQAFSAFRW